MGECEFRAGGSEANQLTDYTETFDSTLCSSSFLHMRYNLGGGHEIDLTFNGTRVSDGLWHRVRIFRYAHAFNIVTVRNLTIMIISRSLREGSLEVDGSEPVIERSPAKLRSFNTDAGLYIGMFGCG